MQVNFFFSDAVQFLFMRGLLAYLESVNGELFNLGRDLGNFDEVAFMNIDEVAAGQLAQQLGEKMVFVPP